MIESLENIFLSNQRCVCFIPSILPPCQNLTPYITNNASQTSSVQNSRIHTAGEQFTCQTCRKDRYLPHYLNYSLAFFLPPSLPPSLHSRPLGCAEADDVLRKCEHVLEVLHQHDEELFSEWTEGLELICQSHLNEPLLMLDTDTGLFQVNFSPAVSKTYQSELKYLYLIVLSVQGSVRCGIGAAYSRTC